MAEFPSISEERKREIEAEAEANLLAALGAEAFIPAKKEVAAEAKQETEEDPTSFAQKLVERDQEVTTPTTPAAPDATHPNTAPQAPAPQPAEAYVDPTLGNATAALLRFHEEKKRLERAEKGVTIDKKARKEAVKNLEKENKDFWEGRNAEARKEAVEKSLTQVTEAQAKKKEEDKKPVEKKDEKAKDKDKEKEKEKDKKSEKTKGKDTKDEKEKKEKEVAAKEEKKKKGPQDFISANETLIREQRAAEAEIAMADLRAERRDKHAQAVASRAEALRNIVQAPEEAKKHKKAAKEEYKKALKALTEANDIAWAATKGQRETQSTQIAREKAEVGAQNIDAFANQQVESIRKHALAHGERSFWARIGLGIVGGWEKAGQINIFKGTSLQEKAESPEKAENFKAWAKKMGWKVLYGAGSVRSLASFALSGIGVASLLTDNLTIFFGSAAARTAMATAGGYIGGSGLSRSIHRTIAERGGKEKLAASNRDIERRREWLQNRALELVSAINAPNPPRGEQLKPLTDEYKKVSSELAQATFASEKRSEALRERQADLAASIVLTGGKGKTAEGMMAEYRQITVELYNNDRALAESSGIDAVVGLTHMLRKNEDAINASIKKETSSQFKHRVAGLVLGGGFFIANMLRMGGVAEAATGSTPAGIETNPAKGSSSATPSTENMSRGAGAIIKDPEGPNQSVWQPGQEANASYQPGTEPNASYPHPVQPTEGVVADITADKEYLAKRLSNLLEKSITAGDVDAVLKEYGFLERPDEMKKLVTAGAAVVIDSKFADTDAYGTALKGMLTDLRDKAASGDKIAAAQLSKFLEQPRIGMKNVDPSELSDAQIKKATLLQIGMKGPRGAVNTDVHSWVHNGNVMIMNGEGKIEVLQGSSDIAPEYTDEKRYLENMARDAGVKNPKDVEFVRGYGVTKIGGTEVGNVHELSSEGLKEELKEAARRKMEEHAVKNPLESMDRTPNIRDLRAYESAKGITGVYDEFKGVGAKEFAPIEVLNNRLPADMPHISKGMRLVGIDYRLEKDAPNSTDWQPNKWFSAIQDEKADINKMEGYHLLASFETKGVGREGLTEAIGTNNSLKNNFDRIWEAARLTRLETIELCKVAGIPLATDFSMTPTGVRVDHMERISEYYRILKGDWSALKVNGKFDHVQMDVFHDLLEVYSGDEMTGALEQAKGMTALTALERAAVLVGESRRSPEALADLFKVPVKIAEKSTVYYDPSRQLLSLNNVEIGGRKFARVLLNTGNTAMSLQPPKTLGLFGGANIPTTLRSLKGALVR